MEVMITPSFVHLDSISRPCGTEKSEEEEEEGGMEWPLERSSWEREDKNSSKEAQREGREVIPCHTESAFSGE
jgi:hypothetical protein